MFDSWTFWVLVALGASVFRLLPDDAVRARAAVLAAIGLCGAWSVLGLTAVTLLELVAAVAWMVAAVQRIGRSAPASKPILAAAAAAGPLLMAWLVGKQFVSAGGAVPQAFFFAGTSYVLVKAWTLAKDRADGRLENFDAVTGAAYFLHLPTYLSGPMHYYAEFSAALRRPYALSAPAVVDIALRLLWGLTKVKLLSPLIQPMSLLALKDVAAPSLGQMALGAVVYSMVLYFDFSGYSDMAIAVSRLVGVDAPENFRLPYLARNVREFWQRWHITFTRVLTGYIFVPLSRTLQKRWPGSPRLVMVTGYLAAFGFAGYWHGPTANFVAWGFYHAVGLIGYDLFRTWRLGRRVVGTRVPAPGMLQQTAAISLTFAFVSAGWIFFVLPLDKVFH